MNINIKPIVTLVCLVLSFSACNIPAIQSRTMEQTVPDSFSVSQDSNSAAQIVWRQYFSDSFLIALIDTALRNNQELNIITQEIQIARNEVRDRKGEYLPFVDFRAGSGAEKVGRYTSRGASEATTEIEPGKEMPDPVPDQVLGLYANWEIDVWHKLRNARKSAVARYLASIEGRNFMITQLISEIAESYYELIALDNELAIVQQNIRIQNNALNIVKLQKQAAKVSELAVRRFEAQLLHTQGLQYNIKQRIIEVENHINYLTGRFPQPIMRNTDDFFSILLDSISAGIPSQLLEYRPDIRAAELEVEAANLDVMVAKANFYPKVSITAALGLQAFNPAYLVRSPESILYGIAADLAAPVINRNAIIAMYQTANAKQIQSVYEYEQTVLGAYIEVLNQLNNIDNLQSHYQLKVQEVRALNESIKISVDLFQSARANYVEVLMTQRDALESRFEQIELQQKLLVAKVNIYRALGGGWN